VEGVILAPQRNPDLQGSCSIATSSVYLITVNRIPSKFDTLFVTPFWVVWQLKGLPVLRLYGFFSSKVISMTTWYQWESGSDITHKTSSVTITETWADIHDCPGVSHLIIHAHQRHFTKWIFNCLLPKQCTTYSQPDFKGIERMNHI